LKTIREVNSSGQSYQLGLNEHSDLSFEEFSIYYNLKVINVDDIKSSIVGSNKAKKFDLDNFKDDDEDTNTVKQAVTTNKAKKFDLDNFKDDDEDTNTVKQAVTTYDWRSNSLAIRNQGTCGSCWAFSTMAQIENSYWMKHSKTSGAVNQYLSTQQLVDCNTTNYGCEGGWPSYAMQYLETSYAMPDSKYLYTGVGGTCKYSSANTTPVRITSIIFAGTYYSTTISTYDLLATGPAVVLVGVNSLFQNYISGIFSGPCLDALNHAVALVGYGLDTTSKSYYYIIRNSWGASWGESGYMRIKDDGVACFIPLYSYQAVLA